MFDIVLKIFILLTPIVCFPANGILGRFQWFQYGYFSGSIGLQQLQLFQYGVVALFITSLFDKPVRLFKDKLFGLLFCAYILSIWFHPSTIKTFNNIFVGFLLYYLVVSYTKDIKTMFKFIIIVSILNTIFAILQYFGIWTIYMPKNEIIGLMLYKSQLGIYQAIAVPLAFSINPWLAIVPAIGLILSKSATAILSCIIIMTIMFKKNILKFSTMTIFMSIISISTLIFIKSFHKMSIRFDVWIPAIRMILEKPFKGWGFGNFDYVHVAEGVQTYRFEYTDPYNIYLLITHALGMFGLIAFVLFIFKHFIYRNNVALYSSCMIVILSCFGYCPLNYPRLAGTTIVLFALLTRSKKEN